MSPLTLILLTFLGMTVLMWFGALAMFVFAKLVGIRVFELSFGLGKLLAFRAAGTEITVGWFPCAGSIRMADNRFPETAADPAVSFDSRPAAIRVLLPLLTILVTFAPGLVLLGPGIFGHMQTALPQLFFGALSPLHQAQEHLATYHQYAGEHGFLLAFAIAATKYGTLTLLPISRAAGTGQALAALGSGKPNPAVDYFTVIATLALLALHVSWLVALITFAIRG